MGSHREIAIIIPAKNEQHNISKVLTEVPNDFQVFLIDDNSSDNTRSEASKHPVIVLKNENSLGYEKTLEVGLREAFNKNFKFAITMDADGQHDIKDVINFASFSKKYDLILGRRRSYPRISENLFHTFSKIICGIQDPLCGLKGYNLEKASQVKFFSKSDTMGFSLAYKMNFLSDKVLELDVNIKERTDSPRLGNFITSELKILKALISFIRIYLKNLNF